VVELQQAVVVGQLLDQTAETLTPLQTQEVVAEVQEMDLVMEVRVSLLLDT
jgi:hypothetical protein